MPAIVKRSDAMHQFRSDIMRLKGDFKMASGLLDPDRMVRIALTTIRQTPKLLECTKESVMGALMTCAQIGLYPDGVGGQAYLIPYKNECKLILGYKGLKALAERSEKVLCLDPPVAVYENDDFKVERGTSPAITHSPNLHSSRGDMVAVYQVARLKGGVNVFEVMTREEIDKIRARSQSKTGPWVTDYVEMSRKTVCRRLCKYLPSGEDLQRAVALDEAAESGRSQGIEIMSSDANEPATTTVEVPYSPPEQHQEATDTRKKSPIVTRMTADKIINKLKTMNPDDRRPLLAKYQLRMITLDREVRALDMETGDELAIGLGIK